MNNKSKLIAKYGTSLVVRRYLGQEYSEERTVALLGRVAKGGANSQQLQSLKEGIFLPTYDIRGGDIVVNSNHSESYVVSGIHPEYKGNRVLSHVANMWKCNSDLEIKGHVRVADDRGNLKSEFIVKYKDIPAYLEEVTNELRQYDPGMHPDTEYKVFTTSLEIEDTDQVTISVLGKKEKMKVISTDYTTYPHMVVLEVRRDVRKGGG